MRGRGDAGAGFVFGVGAYLLWGFFPLYWPLLEPASALEILAWRIVLSLAVVAVILGAGAGFAGLRRLGRGGLARLAAAGAIIAVNWGAYIWGVNSDHVVETSLGYFINPLVTVALGVLVLGERLRRVQWAAIALGALAVVVLTADYGRPPWLALLLAVSFGTYGLIKKRTAATAPEGLFVESLATLIPALALLIALAALGQASFTGAAATPGHLLLLLTAGPVTAVPLLLFAAAARRLRLITIGLLQYLAPALQFAIGVLVRGEPMPAARLGGFALVWLALVVLTADALRHHRAAPPALAEPEMVDVVA